ncbi:glycosyltransferase family 2 protein [Nonomuraea sediminis]|uniref:glycosyltransferase family 2 protein n=1 Tax=Nonomuraea sediminis TaxID=2835864 RepID=UPI001BDBECC4|nr:glycosyltransferase family 2 protein [Nonomuraea sediminis]
MGVKVSVIVSVHNPGDRADACIRSVLEQPMPADEYEVIIVDDGSTDGIAERLDTVAALRSNVRVLHLPHTGSPMRGRNVGLAAAKGTYVYLLDQYDRLARGAIVRMYDRAVETDADVLIGRLVSDVGQPMTAFESSAERADILRDRLLTLLTPHKLLRRSFLEQHGIGFPVPGGRVAEQTFSVRAYLLAKVVAVLAEEVCCHLGAPAEAGEEDPKAVAAELRELFAAIDAHTEEGRQRDRMYAHWFRTTVLRPFLTPRFAGSSVDRGMHFTLARDLVLAHLPERLDRHLPVQLRVVAALIRAGRLDQLITLANASRRAGLRADLREMGWDSDVLVLGLSVEVLADGGEPARFRAEGDKLLWCPPRAIDLDLLPPGITDVTSAVERARVEVYVRHAGTGVIHFLPVDFHVERVPDGNDIRLIIAGEARLDVSTAALGEPLASGQWEVHVRMYGGADQARTRVSRPEGPLNCLGVLAQHPRRRLVVPCWSDAGELGLVIEPRSFCESIALVSPGADLKRKDGHVYVVLPVPYVPPSGGPPIELVLRNTAGPPRELVVPALVEPGMRGRMAGQLVAKVPVKRLAPGRDALGPGAWMSWLRDEDGETGLRFGLEMRHGRVAVCASTEIDPERQSPYGHDSALVRLARRVPGARHLARLARAGKHRYLRD